METLFETNRIVEKIHNEFYSMDAVIDTKLQKEIKDAYDTDKQELYESMTNLGFKNSKLNNTFDSKKLQQKEELNDLLNEYSVSYPGYKFITDEKIQELCKKYNLLLCSPDLYIGDIPLKNQKDIANFKSKHPEIKMSFCDKPDIERIKDQVYQLARDINYGFPHIVSDNDIIKCISAIKNNLEAATIFEDIGYIAIELVNYINSKSIHKIEIIYRPEITINSEIFIAATKDLIDIKEGYSITEDHIVKYKSQYDYSTPEPEFSDPIVFKKLKRGAVIITAWGEEASDELVVNENHN